MAMQSEDNSRASSEYCNRVKEGSWGMEDRWHQYPLIRSWYEAYMCIFHTIPFIPWPRLSQLNQKLIIMSFWQALKSINYEPISPLPLVTRTTQTFTNIHLPFPPSIERPALQVGLWIISYCSSIERPALQVGLWTILYCSLQVGRWTILYCSMNNIKLFTGQLAVLVSQWKEGGQMEIDECLVLYYLL